MNEPFTPGENDVEVTYGQVDLIESRKRYDTLNWYPSNFVEIRFLDEEHVKRPIQRSEPARQTQANLARVEELPTKPCARCGRLIKPRFTYCYRCYNYLEVKKRIQEQAS